MPKVRPLTSGDRMNTYLVSVIDKYKRQAGIRNYEALGPMMGRCGKTANNRINSPGKTQVEELRALVKKLKIPPEELIPIFYE